MSAHTITVRAAAAVLAAFLLAPGCGSARRGEPAAIAAADSGVPAPDDTRVRGRIAFARACYQCHPGGERGLGPSLNDKRLPPVAIRMQVRNGFGAMPAFDRGELSNDDLNAIISYLRVLRRGRDDVGP